MHTINRSTIQPRQAAHADKVSTPPGVPTRIQIGRRLEDYTYARGNPVYATPIYAWDVLVDGQRLATHRTRREAVADARDWQL